SLRHLPSDLGNAREAQLCRISFRARAPSADRDTIRLGQAPALILTRRTEATRSLFRIIVRTRTAIPILGHLSRRRLLTRIDSGWLRGAKLRSWHRRREG